MLPVCPRCGNSFIVIESHWSGQWYNCYKCGWEEPVEEISEEIIQEEPIKLRRIPVTGRGTIKLG